MNPWILVAIGAFLFGPSFHLPNLFAKKPPIAQLSTAEADLAAARAAQLKAEAALAAAKVQEAAKTAAQLDYAQQFAAGTSLALGRVPAEQQTPEVKLATDMAQRANAGLAAARGQLPPEAQAEIQRLVDQALSAVMAERDAYKAAVIQKDAALQSATQDKAALAVQIPVLQATVTTAKAETAARDAKTQELTKEVSVWAEAKAAADAKATSLDAYAGTLVRVLIGLGILYALIHYLLPCVAQSYSGVGWLQKLAAAAKNLTTAHI